MTWLAGADDLPDIPLLFPGVLVLLRAAHWVSALGSVVFSLCSPSLGNAIIYHGFGGFLSVLTYLRSVCGCVSPVVSACLENVETQPPCPAL